MLPDTTYRTSQSEIMDDFAMEGEILRDALDKIASLNRFLGGNKLTRNGVVKLIEKMPKGTVITIADVGCGNGDMLRYLADFAAENGLKCQFIGIDLNQYTIDYARKLSQNYPHISYQCIDIFSEQFIELNYDIALCTLTLHHFKNKEIVKFMNVLKAKSKTGIVINDLHRSKLSYLLFQLVCFFFRLDGMTRNDGSVSILRGFRKEELIAFSKQLNLKKYSIHWKWAFRYQWIIQTA